jgi:hypothetical protein
MEALGDNVYPHNDQKAGDKFSRTTVDVVNFIEKKITNVGAKVADSIRKMERLDLSEFEPEKPASLTEKGEVVPKTLGRKAAQLMMCQSRTLQGTKEECAHLRNSV